MTANSGNYIGYTQPYKMKKAPESGALILNVAGYANAYDGNDKPNCECY